MTSEAPDPREQEDCPGAHYCDSACDQHAPQEDRSRYCKRCDFYTDHVSTAHDGLAARGLLQARKVRA